MFKLMLSYDKLTFVNNELIKPKTMTMWAAKAPSGGA